MCGLKQMDKIFEFKKTNKKEEETDRFRLVLLELAKNNHSRQAFDRLSFEWP